MNTSKEWATSFEPECRNSCSELMLLISFARNFLSFANPPTLVFNYYKIIIVIMRAVLAERKTQHLSFSCSKGCFSEMNPQAELGSVLSDAARNLLSAQHLCCLFCVSQIKLFWGGHRKIEKHLSTLALRLSSSCCCCHLYKFAVMKCNVSILSETFHWSER